MRYYIDPTIDFVEWSNKMIDQMHAEDAKKEAELAVIMAEFREKMDELDKKLKDYLDENNKKGGDE